MSVILKALKSANGKEDGALESEHLNDDIVMDEDEGIFEGKDSFVKKSSVPLSTTTTKQNSFKLIHALIGASILMVSFVLGLKFFLQPKSTGSIPNKIEIITQSNGPAQNNTVNTTTSTTPQTQKPETALPAEIIAKAHKAYDDQDYNLSAKLFKKAIAKDPENHALHNSLGLIYVQKGLYSNASSYFEKALELNDQCPECFNNLGYLKSLLGEPVEAAKYFEKAIALSANYPDPYFNMAVLYEKKGDVGNAVSYFRQFVARHPEQNNPLVGKVTGHIYKLTGK